MTIDKQKEMQTYIDDVFELIAEQPDSSVTREELEQEFQKFIEYGVPLDHAKHTLLKKYTDTQPTQPSTERVLIQDIEPNKFNLHLLGKLISVSPKQITSKGKSRTIFYGILGDESGTIPFTCWHDFQLSKGDIVSIKNAYTREWQGTPQLNFGEKAQVEIKKDVDAGLFQQEPVEYAVKDFRAGLGEIIATVKILDIGAREIESNDTKKTVYSGTIADETGKAQFTSWHDFKLSQGDVVTITGGYIKSWKGIPQLTFDEHATVKKLEKKKLAGDFDTVQYLSMHELTEKRGGLDINVTGTVISIREGSGVVVRCPECTRVLFNEECSVHGKVQGIEALRIKLVLDDGTGSVYCTLGHETTEELLGISLEEMKTSDTTHLLHTRLFGYTLSVVGNALSDQYGTTIIGKKANLALFQLEKQKDELLQELEELV